MYRHADYAGNFADVHKHCLLALLLSEMTRDGGPLTYFDTHAGAGRYVLNAGNRQPASTGINRVRTAHKPPAPVATYLSLVNGCDDDVHRHAYPGSALIACQLLRAMDRAELMELHSGVIAELAAHLGRDSRVRLHHRDGFEGLAAMTPPAQRGVALIDPSYEVRFEFRDLPVRLAPICRHWEQACMMIWYPLMPGDPHLSLIDGLLDCVRTNILDTWIELDRDNDSAMRGCGALLINPPEQLAQRWSDSNAWLARALADDPHRCDAACSMLA